MQEMVRSGLSVCYPPLAPLPLKYPGLAVWASNSLWGFPSHVICPYPVLASVPQAGCFQDWTKSEVGTRGPILCSLPALAARSLGKVFRFPSLPPAVFPVQSYFFPRSIGRLLILAKLEMWRKMKTNRVNSSDCWHYKDIR